MTLFNPFPALASAGAGILVFCEATMSLDCGTETRMTMLTICAEHAGKQLRVAWVSLQPDGSISVGLHDRALIVRDFQHQSFVWSAFNRETLVFVVPHNPEAMKSVAQPHISFHPPKVINGVPHGEWFHVTDGKGKRLFEAIAPMELAVYQQGEVPWIRFVSKPVSELAEAKGLRAQGLNRVIAVPVENSDRSVALSVDFIASGSTNNFAGAEVNEFIDHGKYCLRLAISLIPGQKATLAWIHQR